jgi:hypothetical protein
MTDAKNMNIENTIDNIDNSDITDTFDNLKLYHFDKCDKTSDKQVKELRGNIYDFSDKLVCKTFPFISEYSKNEWKKMNDDNKNLKNIEMFKAVEGTMIRVYFHDNQWHLSTHRKINAFDSYWGSKNSYGEMFLQALSYQFMNVESEAVGENKEENDNKNVLNVEDKTHLFDRFCEKLDTNHVYAFILTPNNDSRIVCEVFDSPAIYICGVFDKNGKYLGLTDESIDKLGIEQIEKVDNFDEIDNINYLEHPGLIIYKKNDEGDIDDVVKVLVDDYVKLSKLRNNQANIKYRYFELRNNQNKSFVDYKLFSDFLALYKNRDNDFKIFESNYLQLNELVFDKYQGRYVKKNFELLGKHLHYILLQCHLVYKSNGIPLNRNKTLEVLDKQNARTILNLFRENNIE